MTQITLASLRFFAPSPSLLYLVGFPIQLAFIPRHGWRVVIRDSVTAHGYACREDAAKALAKAMGAEQEEAPANG